MESDYSERAKDFTEEEKISAFNRSMGATGYFADHPDHFADEHEPVATKAGWSSDRYEWFNGEFEAGEVVIHHEPIIYTRCRNDDPEGRISLSTYLRFYNKEDFDRGAADNRWTNYWHVDNMLLQNQCVNLLGGAQ